MCVAPGSEVRQAERLLLMGSVHSVPALAQALGPLCAREGDQNTLHTVASMAARSGGLVCTRGGAVLVDTVCSVQAPALMNFNQCTAVRRCTVTLAQTCCALPVYKPFNKVTLNTAALAQSSQWPWG
jgi:hypothetical protein